MFMFGVSVNPAIRAILGIAVLVVGIVLRQVVLDAAGGVLILWAGGQWLRHRRSAQ
jgi:threonine/homoserine/homoserine lactone efflux protein